MQDLNYEDIDTWWRTVPGTRRFIGSIMEAVDKHCATAAHLPAVDVEGFIQVLTEKIQRKYVSLIVEQFNYDSSGDLEDFIDALAANFAPNFRRDFTKNSAMEDLAHQNFFAGYVVIIVLNAKVKWLTEAVSDFNKFNSAGGGTLIFISTESNPAPSLTRLSDFLTPYDVQFFALNLLENARLTNRQKLYTSTLAAKLSKQSNLLAKNLAKAELYHYGFDFVKTVLPNFKEKIFNRAVWECQAQFISPALEQIRSGLIEKNFVQLRNILPAKDEFGKILENPWDMELRHLHYYGGSRKIFGYDDWEVLELAYFCRNDLSHLKTLDTVQLEKIFNIAEK